MLWIYFALFLVLWLRTCVLGEYSVSLWKECAFCGVFYKCQSDPIDVIFQKCLCLRWLARVLVLLSAKRGMLTFSNIIKSLFTFSFQFCQTLFRVVVSSGVRHIFIQDLHPLLDWSFYYYLMLLFSPVISTCRIYLFHTFTSNSLMLSQKSWFPL